MWREGRVRRNAQEEERSVARVPAPLPSRGVLEDLRLYVLRRPARATLVAADSPEQREELTRRILQRLGVNVASYVVLSLHRIGVEAPARSVFEELQRWDVTESCWPRHLAALERVNDQVDCVRVCLLGWQLFQMDLLERQDVPSPLDVDNTRLLLYSCSGGYPIGIFSVVVRSSLDALGEREQSQVFFLVSFDFWGKKGARRIRLVKPVWEWIHNRVTANILNRFKALCEARFQELTNASTAPGCEAAAAGVSEPRPES